ncbi:MAG: antitoxin VapB family protein [Nitrososphaerota archaeon]|nr:antitoxin VapB family protein [Nitrososphaerota archaeon]
MAKTIAISDDVYELLTGSKMPGESFSDVIRRRLRRAPLSELAGKRTLTTEEWERAKRQIAAAEQKTAQRLARLQK